MASCQLSSVGYLQPENLTHIQRICMQIDDVEMPAKKHDRWLWYASFWGEFCAFSLRQTFQDEILKDEMDVYRKGYTRVFVNPCKPFALTLLGIKICYR
jgi:hypothetical protein